MVLNNSQNFLASLKLLGLVQDSPLTYLCPPYPPDLLGISPLATGCINNTSSDNDPESGPPTFPAFRRPFSMPEEFPAPSGSWSPVDVNTWERFRFPNMTRHTPLYLALRNTIIYLWNKCPTCLVTPDRAAELLLVRGLVRVVLIDQWLPQILYAFTRMGLVNVGVCSMQENLDASPSGRIEVIGRVDLKTAVLQRQISNYLKVQHSSSTDEPSVAEFLTFRSLPPPPPPPPPVFSETQLAAKSVPRLNVLPTFQSHYFANHVVGAMNNDVVLLAHQAKLTTELEAQATLFHKTDTGLALLPCFLTDRIEFHVEALFDRVVFGPDSRGASTLTSFKPPTVQDAWDSLDQSIRSLLPDLDSSEVEHCLIEYFLACIEERITESLLVSDPRNPPSIVSLSELAPWQTALLLSSKSGPQSPSSSSPPQFLSDDTECDACTLLQVTYGNPSVVFPGANAYKDILDHLISPSERLVVSSVAVSLSGDQQGLFVRRQTATAPVRANSVVICLPLSSLKIVFCDDPVKQLNENRAPDGEASLPIFLPHHFRLSLPQFEPSLQSVAASTETRLCIAVTLVYPSAWWRTLLTEAMVKEPTWKTKLEEGEDLRDGDAAPTISPSLFAVLPEERSARGFCHAFTDLTPQSLLNEFGILQTRIISTSAADYWDKDDFTIANTVHAHLVKISQPHTSLPPAPLCSDVARLSSSSLCDNSTGPSLEATSKVDALVDCGISVKFSDSGQVVAAPDEEFAVSKTWWKLLADAASIYVMAGLTEPNHASDAAEIRPEVGDPLSQEVTTGLEWTEVYLSNSASSPWCAKRAMRLLRRAFTRNAEDLASDGNDDDEINLLPSNSPRAFCENECPDAEMEEVSVSGRVSSSTLTSPAGTPIIDIDHSPSSRSMRYLKRRLTLEK
ncbi:unnamed protein product [Mesocestoides corti]|nr:unnamed protein product [Mesocestoides corti]